MLQPRYSDIHCGPFLSLSFAKVFYWVGFNGIAYVMDVVVADTSSLKTRALVFAFATTPY
jgi:hypothetical protein